MLKSIALTLVLLSVHSAHCLAAVPSNEITVYVDQPTVILPETLYGLFYEDINYSGDGGLYAELVQNRSFEYYPVSGWNPAERQMTRCSPGRRSSTAAGACDLSVEITRAAEREQHELRAPEHREAGRAASDWPTSGSTASCRGAGIRYDFSFYAKTDAEPRCAGSGLAPGRRRRARPGRDRQALIASGRSTKRRSR